MKPNLSKSGISRRADPSRLAIIGAGHVGATAAYALMLRALVREIVLIDNDKGLAEAESADLNDANALARPARIWAGTYEDAATAAIAVITAGAATHGDETRLSVAARSAAIVAQCTADLIEAGFDGIILVAANPVDLMTLVAQRRSQFAQGRVLGTGTLLDTNRLRQALAARLDVAPSSVECVVLGEHGDSEVPAFSTVRIGAVPLDIFTQGNPIDQRAIAIEVRDAAYQIVSGKGYTSFGVATAIVRICEAVLRDERVVLPVSTLVTGEFGIKDVCLSLPCVLGANGVERVLEPPLVQQEIADLHVSAEVLRAAWASIDA
jgi:L-lactate dehydrogenase